MRDCFASVLVSQIIRTADTRICFITSSGETWVDCKIIFSANHNIWTGVWRVITRSRGTHWCCGCWIELMKLITALQAIAQAFKVWRFFCWKYFDSQCCVGVHLNKTWEISTYSLSAAVSQLLQKYKDCLQQQQECLGNELKKIFESNLSCLEPNPVLGRL